MQQLSNSDRRTLEQYNEFKKNISRKTGNVPRENLGQQRERIAKLKGNFEQFAAHYFPHYMTEGDGKVTPFGWFHKKAVRDIQPNTMTVLEWAREHAKSVFADIMLPLFLYANGNMTGMVVASANGKMKSGDNVVFTFLNNE